MTRLNEFIMNNIDLVFVVNKDFDIIYNSRFDEHIAEIDNEFAGYEQYRNLFLLYPTLNRNNSTIAKTMSTGEAVVTGYQKLKDVNGKIYITQSITFPIFKNGQIIGAVELAKDLTTVKDIHNKKYIDEEINRSSVYNLNDENHFTFEDILTEDNEMKHAIEQAKFYTSQMSPTLIYGETGTGKELFAQAMIQYADVSEKKVVVQNCAAVPENLIESILFGTTKGSYTGAENKKGLFEEADGGILFLDELNALPYQVQGKLLRVLQDGTFRPIGSNSEKRVNVKIIAAMNVDPMEAIEANVLRKDLFYRLSGGMIFLPPLRNRKSDIAFLTKHYIDEYNRLFLKDVKGLSNELQERFMTYKWEGNVRELKHVIESMVSMARGTILSLDDVPLYLHNKINLSTEKNVSKSQEDKAASEPIGLPKAITNKDNDYDLKTALYTLEREYISRALKETKGNISKAGELLNIPRQTLNYKIKKLYIHKETTWNAE